MASNKTVKQLSVKFEGDTKGLNTAIKQATKALKDVDKAINTLDKNFDKFGKGSSIEEQVEKFDLLQKKIEEGSKALKELKDFQKQLDNESDNNKLTSAYQNLKLKISEVEKELEEAKLQQEKLNDSNLSKILATYAKIKNKVAESNEQFSKSSSYINVLNKALDYSPNSIELLNAKTITLNDQMKGVNNEVISLSRYLAELKNLGVSETSKEFLEVSNTVESLKEKYASLKAETVAYQQALSSVSKLQADMASRGAKLREALSIDPKNEEVIRQYTNVLKQELKEAEKSAEAFRIAIDSMPKGIKKTSKEYINLTTGLVKAEETIKQITLEQERWNKSGRTTADSLDRANNVLSKTKTNAQILKEALELDPTNLSKASEYCGYLKEASTKCTTQIKSLNELLKNMDNGKVEKTKESYNKTKATINDLTRQLKYFEEEQKKLSPEAIKYNEQLKNLKTSLSNMDRVAKVLKDSLELDPGSVEKQTQYTDYLKKAIQECENQQRELNAQINSLDVSNTEVLNGKYVELSEVLSSNIKLSSSYRDELARINGESQNASIGTNNLVSDFAALNNILPAIERNLAKVTSSLFDNAKSYETNISSIRKVVKDLSDDTVDNLKQIASSTGNTFESISGYATLGATLGIAEKDLSKFTKAMVDLEVASDKAITGEEGAARVARLLNQFKIGADYAENFGSSVTYVGDQFAATANEILETASYMGGLSAVNNVTIHDLIGMASEMKNLGVESSSGASAISKTFLKINTQVATCGKDLEQFAETAGMTSEQFTQAWEQAPTDAFLSFINGLSTQVFDEINSAVNYGTNSLEGYAKALGVSNDEFKAMWKLNPEKTFNRYKDALGDLEEGSTSASVVLEDLKLSGVRVAQTLLKMAGNGDVVREAIKDSNKAWKDNTNLVRKANEMYNTTEGKLNQTKEAINQAAAALGDQLLPMAKTAADVTRNVALWIGQLPEPIKTTSGVVLVLAAGLGKLLTTASRASISLSLLENSSGALGTAVKGVTSSLAASGGLISVLGSALPVALGVAGAWLVAYTAYSAYANDETRKFNKLLKELSEDANKQFVSSLQEINNEMVDVNTIAETVQETARGLDLNPNGTIDTTSDKYKLLQEKISELNGYLGSDFQITLDNTTGKFVDQHGEIVNLDKALANHRLELERQAWLNANQDKYNESLKTSNEQYQIMTDKYAELIEQRETLKGLPTAFSQTEIDSFVKAAARLEDVSGWSEEAKNKYNEFIDTYVNNGGKFSDTLKSFNEAKGIYEETNKIVTQFNEIETAPLEQVRGLIDDLTTEAKLIALDYNKESLDSCYEALDKIHYQILANQELAAEGIDTTKDIESLEKVRQQVESDIETLTLRNITFQQEVSGSADNMVSSFRKFAKESGVEFDNTQIKAISSFKEISNNSNLTSGEMIEAFKKFAKDSDIEFSASQIKVIEMFEKFSKKSKTTSIDMVENLKKFSENSGIDLDLLAKKNETTVDEMLDKWAKDYFPPLLKKHKESADNIIKEIDRVNKTNYQDKSFTTTQYIKTVYQEEHQSVVYKNKGKGSGGFGYVPNLTIPSLRSSGQGTSALTLNTTINVNNNGKSITKSDVNSWSQTMVDRINEELGRLL